MGLFRRFRRPPGLLLAGLLASLATPAAAAIYKCQEPGGPTTYQETPCTSGGAAADIRAHQPSPEEREAARQRGQQDQAAARELERQQEARRLEGLRDAERRRNKRREAQARCEKYLADAQTLAHRGETRTKEHDRRRDEQASEDLRNRHFSECFAGR
jgi:uncharacterized protein DUF4124